MIFFMAFEATELTKSGYQTELLLILNRVHLKDTKREILKLSRTKLN